MNTSTASNRWLSGLRASLWLIYMCVSCNVGCRNAPETRAERSGDEKAHDAAQPALGGKARASVDAPALTIANSAPGLFVLRAQRDTRISVAAQLERATDGSNFPNAAAIETALPFPLIEGCPSGAASACRQLRKGETLVPLAWTGSPCKTPCDGATCATQDYQDYQSGQYRLIVRDCDAPKVTYHGLAFELPGSAAMMARWQAGALAEHASIVRLNPKDLGQSTATRDSQRVAGFAVLPAPAVDLDASALATLVDWLGTREGFNDRVLRRCARGAMIGIVATRKLPNNQEDRTELALDFNCNSLIVVRDQAGRRTETSAFFDASRKPVLELARRLLPDDQELSRVR